MKTTNYQEDYFESIRNSLSASCFRIDKVDVKDDFFFESLINLVETNQKKGGRLFFFGNGASAAFSNHMALDWSKNGGILSLSLSDSALLTALSNDYSYNEAFVEFLKINTGNSNDIVVTVSSSGNSANIVNVLDYCGEKDIATFGLSGLKDQNETVKKARYSLYVPRKTYGIVECIHQIYLHLWLDRYMGIEDWNRDTYQNMDASNYNV